jgi:Protein of unknown function (DUF3093)
MAGSGKETAVTQPTIEEVPTAHAEAKIYRERQWIPFWVVAALFAGMFAFILIVFAFLDLVVTKGDSSLSFAAQLAIAAAGGAFIVAIALYSVLLVVITVQNGTLRVGRRGSVPLTSSVEAAVVRGEDVKKLRENMNVALSPGGALTPFGQLGGAVGSATVGVSAITAARRGRGMVAAFWMHEAVVVHAPDTVRTKLWLIGTRHPDELVAAIRSQIDGDSASG